MRIFLIVRTAWCLAFIAVASFAMAQPRIMRSLYHMYYKEKNPGFTDDEFRQACETVAGGSLQEIFGYASTVREIDYPKYFSYAGLDIDVAWKKLPMAYFGATVREADEGLTITGIEWNSPAWQGGLSSQDIILSVNEMKASRAVFGEVLKAAKPGDTVTVKVTRRGRNSHAEVVLGERSERSFLITPYAQPEALQTAVLKSWLKE